MGACWRMWTDAESCTRAGRPGKVMCRKYLCCLPDLAEPPTQPGPLASLLLLSLFACVSPSILVTADVAGMPPYFGLLPLSPAPTLPQAYTPSLSIAPALLSPIYLHSLLDLFSPPRALFTGSLFNFKSLSASQGLSDSLTLLGFVLFVSFLSPDSLVNNLIFLYSNILYLLLLFRETIFFPTNMCCLCPFL